MPKNTKERVFCTGAGWCDRTPPFVFYALLVLAHCFYFVMHTSFFKSQCLENNQMRNKQSDDGISTL